MTTVLMPEGRSGAAATAARVLRGGGHQVVFCNPDGGRWCVAVRGGRCPLEVAPVDVALMVRSGVAAPGAPGEELALCAARLRVPLVIAGAVDGHPYADLASVEDESADVLTTVETVHRQPLPEHTVVASVALHRALHSRGLPDGRGEARVWREGGRLVARLRFSDRPASAVVAAAAVRVAGALRELDPWARGIDLGVEE